MPNVSDASIKMQDLRGATLQNAARRAPIRATLVEGLREEAWTHSVSCPSLTSGWLSFAIAGDPLAIARGGGSSLRTSNVIEWIHEEFRRCVKMRRRDAGLALQPCGHGQIKWRRTDGWRKIAAVVSRLTAVKSGRVWELPVRMVKRPGPGVCSMVWSVSRRFSARPADCNNSGTAGI
jgi:hypothetical protein